MEQRLIALHLRMLDDLTASDLETTLRVLNAFSATDQSADDASNEPQIAEGGLQESSVGAFHGS